MSGQVQVRLERVGQMGKQGESLLSQQQGDDFAHLRDGLATFYRVVSDLPMRLVMVLPTFPVSFQLSIYPLAHLFMHFPKGFPCTS